MRFADIPAHENVKQLLREMVDNNRLPHALLLEGPAGVGKFALARALAQYIHCENRHDGDSCGVCPSCKQHQEFNQLDTVYSFPILKSESASAISDDLFADFKSYLGENRYMNFDKWLAALNNPNGQPVIYSAESAAIARKFALTSYSTRYKILLMWLPERMQPECANKMLKMIEEPLSDSIMIFTSNNSQEILPTIYSRMQRVKVRRVDDVEIEDFLVKQKGVPADEAAALAPMAEGSFGVAEELITSSKTQNQYFELFVTLMRHAYQRKVGLLRKWSVDAAGLGREGAMRFLDYCERMMRENFISNLHVASLVNLNPQERSFSSRFSPFINERNVERLLEEFGAARVDIAANGNAKIIFFDLAVKVILLLKQ
jgi:DNA polymerase-3 subunit delta'